VSLLPVVRRTWAPRGQTPVLVHRFGWKRISLAAMVAYPSCGTGRPRLLFHALDGAYNEDVLMDVIEQLRCSVRGAKVTLVWDRLTGHRSHRMRAFLARQRHWLVAELLPSYGHELNPVEGVWGNLKSVDFANVCCDSTTELHETAHAGMRRIRSTPRLLAAFLRRTGLGL